MNVYIVMFENEHATEVLKTDVMQHGDVAFYADESVKWYAIECENEELAKHIAQITVKKIWGILKEKMP